MLIYFHNEAIFETSSCSQSKSNHLPPLLANEKRSIFGGWTRRAYIQLPTVLKISDISDALSAAVSTNNSIDARYDRAIIYSFNILLFQMKGSICSLIQRHELTQGLSKLVQLLCQIISTNINVHFCISPGLDHQSRLLTSLNSD